MVMNLSAFRQAFKSYGVKYLPCRTIINTIYQVILVIVLQEILDPDTIPDNNIAIRSNETANEFSKRSCRAGIITTLCIC